MPKALKHADMDPEAKARLVAGWLDEKKAEDVKALDVRGLSGITEILVLATATSPRHAQGVARNLMDKVAEHKLEFLGMEGMDPANWILVDLNDVLVHIFLTETRDFYNLEGLWAEAAPIDIHTS